MIPIDTLTEADIGRWVTYRSSEPGRIKTWNPTFIFVVYHSNGDWNNFALYDAFATLPEDLEFR